jgi:hypothetical protein
LYIYYYIDKIVFSEQTITVKLLGLAARVTLTSKNSPSSGIVAGSNGFNEARSKLNRSSSWVGDETFGGVVGAVSGIGVGVGLEAEWPFLTGAVIGTRASGISLSFSSNFWFMFTSSSPEVSKRIREMS